MRIEPIYLVAPEPESPRLKPTRRRFLLAAAGGLLVGAVGGFGLGRASARELPPVGGGAQVVPEEVGWARTLRDGPVDALVRDRQTYLVVVASHPSFAPELRSGIESLADAVLGDELDRRSARDVAADLVQFVDAFGELAGKRLQAQRNALDRIGR